MDICFGHAGNGIGVWRKGQDGYLAHISPERVVKIYAISDFTQKEKDLIYQMANEDDGAVSTTQPDTYIFNEPPPFIRLGTEYRGVEMQGVGQATYRGWHYKWQSERVGWVRTVKIQ